MKAFRVFLPLVVCLAVSFTMGCQEELIIETITELFSDISLPIITIDPADVVIIDWILADAPGEEPDGEIIRLRNKGDQVVDISGWWLTDEEGDYIIPKGTRIAPHSTWEVRGSEYNPRRNKRGLFLNNRKDSVSLFDNNNDLVDFNDWG